MTEIEILKNSSAQKQKLIERLEGQLEWSEFLIKAYRLRFKFAAMDWEDNRDLPEKIDLLNGLLDV